MNFGLLYAQDDIHFTQYDWIPIFQNPALSTVDPGHINAGLLYRDQSFNVTSNQYQSLAAYLDSEVAIFNHKYIVSGILLDDKAGDGQLNTTQLGLGLSRKLSLDQQNNHFITVGAQAKFIQRSYGDLGAFILEEELQNGVTTEVLNNESYSYPDLNLGVLYTTSIADKNTLNIGFSIHHLNNSLQSNNDVTIDKYPFRINWHSDVIIPVSNSIAFQPRIQYQRSSIYHSTQLQSLLHLTVDPKKNIVFSIGGGYRLDDALEALLALRYGQWELAFAYDKNTSGLQRATNNVSALEVGLRYRFHKKETETPEIVDSIEAPIIPEVALPLKTPLEIEIPDTLIDKKIRIIIREDSLVILDSVQTIWPLEYELEQDRFYEFVIELEGYERDSIQLDPGSFEPSIPQNRIFNPSPLIPEVEPEPEEEMEITVYLEEPIVIENIFYDFDKSDIIEASAEELQIIFDLMVKYPEMVIELGSHTDVRGSDEYNIALSQRRAESAKNWLVNKGIASERIVAKGYGETILLNHCDDGIPCPEHLHRINRRTEFKILSGPTSVKYKITKKIK